MTYQPERIVVEGKELNYYEFLNLETYQPTSGQPTSQSLSPSEIRKAYRARALIYHPDKNPGDEISAQLFLQLKKVHDVLVDPQRRGEYDRYLSTTFAKRQRIREMDGARKKVRDELLQREKAARDQKEQEYQDAARFESELDRMRRNAQHDTHSTRQRTPTPPPQPTPIDPITRLKDQLQALESQLTPSDTTLKLKWKRKAESHDQTSLNRLLVEFGAIDHILLSTKKSGTALVSYNSVSGPHAAMAAYQASPEKFGSLEFSWANSTHQEPKIVGDILKLKKKIALLEVQATASKPSTASNGTKAPNNLPKPLHYEPAIGLSLAQLEEWTLARAKAFDYKQHSNISPV